MSVYLYVILAYLLVLTGYNIYRSRQIKSQEDFMVAGRSLSLTKMVFTLVCTWIGSGTFIAGAEFASYAGWSAVWQPAGAFLGIAPLGDFAYAGAAAVGLPCVWALLGGPGGAAKSRPDA